MAATFAKGFSTASKRSRSQDSPQRASTPILRAQDIFGTPAFLRQSKIDVNVKFRDLQWQEKSRILQGRNDPNSQWAQDLGPHVVKRNRYVGVQPWDKSRVHLKVADGQSDYINASPITLHDPATGQETKYIATQGPKEIGLSHFWQMVWHETGSAAVIVMLSPTEESGKEKCFQYFPLDADAGSFMIQSSGHENDASEGSVTFVETSSNSGPNTTVRRFDLRFGSKTKTIWHLLFTAFPDFGVPEDEDRAELLELLKLSAEMNIAPSNPRIIHCSAGVGRSGTFIALEYLLSQLDSGFVAAAKEDEDMVQEVVHRLREQRMMMVQMDTQYQFLYDVLREGFEKRQLAERIAAQPSPKFRKLSRGTGVIPTEQDLEHEELLDEKQQDGNVELGDAQEVKETAEDQTAEAP